MRGGSAEIANAAPRDGDDEIPCSGTIGQPDAGALSGGTFTLGGGFWGGGSGAANLLRFFLPAIMKNP